MATEQGNNDDRPIELPISKKPIRKKHQKEETSSLFTPRDPRFDPNCSGSNDTRHFLRNYSFVDDLRNDELNRLKKALRSEKDPEKAERIKVAIGGLRNKMVDLKNKSQKTEIVDQLRSSQREQGRKRAFVKKSDVKKTLIVSKYKELKQSGKLTKYLERKRKKLINRDERSLG